MDFNFLMCSERSGSNLVTRMLNGHREICGPATKHILNPLARNLFRYGDLTDARNWTTLVADVHGLLSANFSLWKTAWSLEQLERLAPPGDVAGLIRGIYESEANAHDKKSLFVKENQIYNFMGFIGHYFPEALFVYQVRDPRDMALSWKRNPSHRGGVIAAAEQWKKDQQMSLMNFDLLKREGRIHLLKYEDLISDPARKAAQLVNFLGHEDDPDLLNFHKDAITIANARHNGAWDNLQRGVITNNSNKFSSGLSSEEIVAVETICFYEMLVLGYESTVVESAADMAPTELIDTMRLAELRETDFRPTDGVVENMAKKSVFYSRHSRIV